MTIKLTVDDAQFADRVDKALEKIETNMQTAMQLAGDMVASHAKLHHEYKDHTNILTDSIGAEQVRGSFARKNLSVTVSAGAPYALYVEKGTRPHVIRAKRRKALRWATADGFAFAKSVRHPGTRPYLFLQGAVDAKSDAIDRVLMDALRLSFAQAGFKLE